jgi:predicted amidohydrolase
MRFKTEQFMRQPENKCFVVEASELGLAPGTHVGHTVSLDGNDFHYYSAVMDASGEDVMGWRFKPTVGTLQKSKAFAGWQVLIIND